ncbi:unnamed protein product [Sphagnum troendelagicum]|uniref:Uncharacterized protein n=1 Tax=Sphagnum troendelagicum TaxID=128251 RepID=A0ABP0UJ77_9BRYO
MASSSSLLRLLLATQDSCLSRSWGRIKDQTIEALYIESSLDRRTICVSSSSSNSCERITKFFIEDVGDDPLSDDDDDDLVYLRRR